MEGNINNYINNGKLYITDSTIHDESDEKYYELKMITGNDIPVFLSCKKLYEDQEERYVYDISSMISLSEYAKNKPLTMLELEILLESLDESREMVEKYLLSIEGLILDPELVFYDRNSKKIKYCFYPWNDKECFSTYTKIAEFLLSAIDYSDEEAVKVAYELYANVLNKNYAFTDLINHENTKADEPVISTNVDTCDVAGNDEKYRGYDMAESKREKLEEKGRFEEMPERGAKHMSLGPMSIICLTALCLIITFILALLIWSRRLFLLIFANMKVLSVTVATLSILAYIPIVNMLDISRYKKELRQM